MDNDTVLIVNGQEVIRANNMASNIDYPIDPKYKTMQDEINELSDDVSKRLSFPNINDILFSGTGTYIATKDYFVTALGFSSENLEYPTTVNGKKVSVSNYAQNQRVTFTNWFGKKGDTIVATTATTTVYGLV